MEDTEKKCIECGGATHPIKIIDRGQKNIHYGLIYTAEGSKRNIFKGYPKEGEIGAELCDSCGRITLRAVPSN